MRNRDGEDTDKTKNFWEAKTADLALAYRREAALVHASSRAFAIANHRVHKLVSTSPFVAFTNSSFYAVESCTAYRSNLARRLTRSLKTILAVSLKRGRQCCWKMPPSNEETLQRDEIAPQVGPVSPMARNVAGYKGDVNLCTLVERVALTCSSSFARRLSLFSRRLTPPSAYIENLRASGDGRGNAGNSNPSNGEHLYLGPSRPIGL